MDKLNTVWKMIKDLAQKKNISEIVINDGDRVFVERKGRFTQLNIHLKNEDILSFINEVASYNRKKFDLDHPILDGLLPDGSRINIVSTFLSDELPAITIRRYLNHIKSFDENPEIFGLDKDWIMFFKSCVYAKLNLIISGGTGVGKTTFLNLLLKELSPQERIITIEDTLELSVTVPNLVRLEVREKSLGNAAQNLSMRDLVKNTLRMRPDRIIIGEVRGGEFFDLLQAMNTGHNGCMTSIHANSARESLSRMENLFLFSGQELPFHVVRKQISDGINLIVQISRNSSGERVISEVSEVAGMEGQQILTSQIAVLKEDKLVKTGVTPKCIEDLHHLGRLPLHFFRNLTAM